MPETAKNLHRPQIVPCRAAWLVLAGLLIGTGTAAAATMIPSSVTVNAPVIRLGDILPDAGAAKDVVIAPAPEPGKKLVLSGSRVRYIARRYGLSPAPIGVAGKIVITRASRVVSADELDAAIRGALAGDGVSDRDRLEFNNGAQPVYVAAGANRILRVRTARYNRRTGRFWAELSASGEASDSRPIRLSGRVVSMIEVPVLNRPIRPGDRIAKADIEWAKVAARRMPQNLITDASALIGLSPRRPLRRGVPISAADVRAPIVIAKGTVVVMILRSRNMVLQAKIRALEDGAAGRTIRLINPRSNRVVEGVVEGPGRVGVPSNAFNLIAATSGGDR